MSIPYPWPYNGLVSLSNTALVVIDMQADFCCEGGYLESQGYNISCTRAIIPAIQTLLALFRDNGYPIFHTREGHRSDMSTISNRELLRSRNNPSGLGIGDKGLLGRFLIRGEKGHDIINEVYPREDEPIVDKPGKGAFAYTDFELLLRVKGISNLVICGVTTDVCVHTTMREANDRGFDCLLVQDACAAATNALHQSAVDMVVSEGGIFGAVGSVQYVEGRIEKKGSRRR